MPARGYRGRLVRLAIGDAAAPEGFSVIAGLRTTAATLNNNPVDATTVESGGFRELLPDGGLQSLTVSGDGIVAEGASDRALYAKAVARSLANYRLSFENGDRFEGAFAISRFVRTGAQADAETFSVTLESSGPLNFTPGEGGGA